MGTPSRSVGVLAAPDADAGPVTHPEGTITADPNNRSEDAASGVAAPAPARPAGARDGAADGGRRTAPGRTT
ncbi:hypothetical protein FraQA3DRAFT_5772 [Frankia sp. QA3]|nr:hypothetical protein FraQA3DRAFT_5772 [Frankia sp. QA3]